MGRQRISRFTNLSPKNGGLRASDMREAAPLSLLIKSGQGSSTLPRRSAYRLRVERLQRRRNLLGNRRDPWFVTGETRRLNCGTGPLEPPGNWNLVVGNV